MLSKVTAVTGIQRSAMIAVIFLLCLTASTDGQAPGNPASPAVTSHSYTVELLAVVDKRAYNQWYDKIPGPSVEARKTETSNMISAYIKAVVTGMNNLYESMKTSGLSVDVRLKQIYFLSGDLWGREKLRPGYDDQLISDKALEAFYAWSVQARSNKNIRPFDHAMLITGYNILDPKDPEKLTTGVAYKGVICKYGSISVIELTFSYQMIDTSAHELGHSLGADHDAENNDCDMTLGNVMSSRTEINSTGRWTFSPCSVSSIKNNMAQLNQLGTNCLLETVTAPTPPQELGELFSPDQQCRLLKGPEGFFCRDFYDNAASYSSLCTSMWCSRSSNDSHCQNFISSDGFVCGNRKICRRGACVSSYQAGEVPDDCPQGDEPGKVFKDLSCQDIISLQPWLCYHYLIQRKCCATCPTVRQNVSGCEYGDKEAWCSTRMRYPYDCYLNEKTCCRSCRPHLRPDFPGCEYGDKSPDCQNKLTFPIGCYQNEKLCCETCAKAKNETNPDCPYGDKRSWCKGGIQVPSGCYRNRLQCCSTCAPYANDPDPNPSPPSNPSSAPAIDTIDTSGPGNCSSGDREPSWCRERVPHDCYNASVAARCCKSCPTSFNATRTGCEYGDKKKSCDVLVFPYACYQPTNVASCCQTCSLYLDDSRTGCEYGDKRDWCYKLRSRFAGDQWCHLDLKNGHCCGTCMFNQTAIPTVGRKIRVRSSSTPGVKRNP